MRITILLVSLVWIVPVAPLRGQDHAEGHTSPYAGLEGRGIASLSDDDIAELQAGGGWGFALPAELNGLPGPRHVLDMADALGLSDEQRARVEALFDSMRSRAAELGSAFVERERILDAWFERVASGDGDADAALLVELVNGAGTIRSELRAVHLGAHLEMLDILTPEQVSAYVRLRGYSSDDPCENVPEGHDEAMWRQHNNCDG